MQLCYQFQRELWEKEYFTDKNPLGWRCSKCGVGQLRAPIGDDKPLRARETGAFASMLKCTNDSCKTKYTASGHWGKYNLWGEQMSYEFMLDCERRYYPKYFHPFIELFSTPQDIPSQIKLALGEAFLLFWTSPSACGNAIRSTVEQIMDERGFTAGKLHDRINSFKNSDSVNGEKLLAIKWIGNAGSHDSSLTKSDTLDGFFLLAQVLSSLYPDAMYSNHTQTMVDSINNSKQPRSKII
jgi:hypothetical protein